MCYEKKKRLNFCWNCCTFEPPECCSTTKFCYKSKYLWSTMYLLVPSRGYMCSFSCNLKKNNYEMYHVNVTSKVKIQLVTAFFIYSESIGVYIYLVCSCTFHLRDRWCCFMVLFAWLLKLYSKTFKWSTYHKVNPGNASNAW